ncbi:MAG: RagB/SusD family nutrient uptake outer membrane protein, partial [Cyclobacteriaceae bacterium]|nr:RagB/SusD family nutrient uptake outer membrane protein [Cyclobacteriaceae bacterium]
FVGKFADITGATDWRANFYTDGQTLDIADILTFANGYPIPKYTNIDSKGNPGKHVTFPDTDFPMFRLADAYLMYAEAVLRGGTGGDVATALTYVNMLRERAYGDTSGNISAAELTEAFLLDERARELHWEGHRRVDLIRYNQYTENGIWPWKGGVADGITTSKHLDIFPLPSSEMIANPNLVQNTGY